MATDKLQVITIVSILLHALPQTVQTNEKVIAGYGIEFRKQKDILFGASVVDIVLKYPVTSIVPVPKLWNAFESLGRACNDTTSPKNPELCDAVRPLAHKYKTRRIITNTKLRDNLKIIKGLAPNLDIQLPKPEKPHEYVFKNISQAVEVQKNNMRYLAAGALRMEQSINAMQSHLIIDEDKKHISISDMSPIETSENSAELADLKGSTEGNQWGKMFPSKLCPGASDVLQGERTHLRELAATAFMESGKYASLPKEEKQAITVYAKDVFDNIGDKLKELCEERKQQVTQITHFLPKGNDALLKSKLARLITADKTLVNTYMTTFLDIKVKTMTNIAENQTVSAQFLKVRDQLREFRNSRRESLQKVRHKRFLDLVSFGMSAYTLARTEQMGKAINMLNKHTKEMAKNVEVLHGDMTALTTYVELGMQKTHSAITTFQGQMNILAQSFIGLRDTLTTKLSELSMKVFYTSLVNSVIEPLLLRDEILHNQQLHQVEQTLQAMQVLDQGRLPPYILPPEKLHRIIKDSMEKLQKFQPTMAPVFKETNEYYQYNLIRFEHDTENLYIQIPIFIAEKNPVWYDLYKTRTVPVPMTGNNTNVTYFTRIDNDKQYLAVTNFSHVELDIEDVRDCVELGTKLICTKEHLEFDFTKQTCLSSIYRGNFQRNHIRQLCNFKMVPASLVQPQILETPTELLLANIKTPWKVKCNKDSQTPAKIYKDTYVVIPRKTLCKCKIDTKDFTLEPRPDACSGRQKRNPVFKYTVNQAFVSYWPDLNKEFPDDIMRLFSSPPNVSIPVVNITSFSFPDVLEKDWQNYELSLSTFADTVKKHELIWKDKSSKLHQELIDIKQGFTFKIPSFLKSIFRNWKITLSIWGGILLFFAICYIACCCHNCCRLRTLERSFVREEKPIFRLHNLKQRNKQEARELKAMLSNPDIEIIDPEREIPLRKSPPQSPSIFKKQYTTPYRVY